MTRVQALAAHAAFNSIAANISVYQHHRYLNVRFHGSVERPGRSLEHKVQEGQFRIS
jgi:hypothetical protein